MSMEPKKRKASPSETTSKRATTSTSRLDCGSDRDFEVFLNFRGPDSRYTVANVLYHTLTCAGFRVFLDDEEIRKGEVIEGELLRAIINSKIYIVIFSKDYASSRWCLRELAQMVECWKSSSDKTKKVILPVFSDVNASEDIKLRSQMYTNALKRHEEELGEVAVKPWKDALKDTAKIKGWNLKDHGLTGLADLIKKEVFNILNASEAVLAIPDRLVGIHDQIEAIMQLLDEGSPHVRFIVIHGMGGIGKTTIANSIFGKIFSRFQGSCILLDIRRSSSVNDMVKLQEKLLSDILNLKFIKVSNIDDGIGKISSKLCNKKVLIILDDVDQRIHLTNLAARFDWFGPKSRIIITTRNINFLPTKDNKEYCFYEMKEMDHCHALQLFCKHAFEDVFLPPEYYDISSDIVATTGGLPLALQVIGSSLFNQDDETWKLRLKKLKEAPHKDVREMLMISYEALEYEEKEIFLDIACFFNNEEKLDPIYFWETCDFYPSGRIKILVRKSLIKVNDHNKLWMHDQLRDLGRAIAQPQGLGLKSLSIKPSRLWSPEVALDVIRKKEVVESIVALELGVIDAGCSFVREEFAGSINLKFLQLQGGNFEGDFDNVLHQLRWLSWFNCPLKIEATNLSFQNLVVLKLSGPQITEDWSGWGRITVAKQLKVLNMIGCICLTKTPNFSAFLGLERLIMIYCLGLEEIDKSITKLKHLNYLEISNGSRNFRGYSQVVPPRTQLLPHCIGGLKSLMVLKINNVGLTELPLSIKELVNLKHLCLRCPHLRNLPDSIGKLMSLVELDISFSRIKELPNSIGDLKQLNILRIEDTAILYLPDSIGRLESLNELQLSRTKIIALPETIGDLKKLRVINLSSTSMRKLPKALGKEENLEELQVAKCDNMDGELLEEIGELSRLRVLNLCDTKVSRVPRTIGQLSHLHELVLGEFCEPQQLPELPVSLTSLAISFSSLESHRVPDLSYMTNLVTLTLFGATCNEALGTFLPCVQTPKMEWLATLRKLEKLTVVLPVLILPPTDLSSLSRLQMLNITCFNPQSLTHLPSSLENLTLQDIKSPSEWQLFSCLNNLSTLKLHRCRYREIQVDGLGQLKNLHLQNLKLEDSEFLKSLSNLSCLRELQNLEIVNCPQLVDLQDLGEVKFLRSLSIVYCRSIRWLPDLSSLNKLKELRFAHCESLESIPIVDGETPCYLYVLSCEHLVDFQGPYTELKHAIVEALYKRSAAMSWTPIIGDHNVQKLLGLKPL